MLVMLLLLVLVSQHISGVEVEVQEGADSVLLPCHVPADVSRGSTTTVWDRDEFKVPTVHVRHLGGDDLSDQNNYYSGRTSMRADALQTGDLSLTLRNPTVSDSGTYTCTTSRLGQERTQTEVQLEVKERPPTLQVWQKILLAGLVGVLAACCIHAACMKRDKRHQLEILEVIQEHKSVQLRFTTTDELPQDATVKWRITEPKDMTVHVYESGKNQPDKQDKVYKGRTEMVKEPLRTGDLSLKLKDLQLTDSGVYTCTVCNKDGDILKQKVTRVIVRVPRPQIEEATEGQKSVLLPFQTTANLPKHITVEWRLTEPKYMMVHVYERGTNHPDKQHQDYRGRTEMDQEQPRSKDLSLTLKNIKLTDSGVYTCTVYNEDGLILLKKSVTLSVRDSEMKVITVIEEQKSVLLAFQPTEDLPQKFTVEWRLKQLKYMAVHVYKKGTNHQDKHDKDYRGHTEMVKDPLKTGDFSLTLKHLQLTDSGVYTCTVYDKGGNIKDQRSVRLSFKGLQPEIIEVTQEEESVLLPFKTTPELPQDITVEWRFEEPKDMNDHLQRSGINQPKMHEMMKTRHREESVLLPVQPTEDLPQDIIVVWRITEPKHMMVHVHEGGKNQPDKQNKDYRGRTEMVKDPLKTGDFSLKLKGLQHSDSGVYTCTVYDKDGNIKDHRSMRLSFKGLQPEIIEVTQGEESVLLPFKTTPELPQDITVEGRFEEPKDMNDHLQRSGINQPKMHEMMMRKHGEESALLPLKSTANLPKHITVEWRLTEPKYMMVHVYERGTNHPDKQHQDYRGRTEMDQEQPRSKDLSLTLKNIKLTDSGVYTCTVYNQYGLMLLQKSVTLSVRGLQPEIIEVTQGEESVLLPFKTTLELPQDVRVKWSLTDCKERIVHVYDRRGNEATKQHSDYSGRTKMHDEPLRTGVLSLTLKKPRPNEDGVYTCMCYNDGHILLQKLVKLRVKGTPKWYGCHLP